MSAGPRSLPQRRRDTEHRLGHTRDVSMIESDVEVLEMDALPRERGDRFAARTGFDPRTLATPYRLVPHLPAPHPGLARGERAARPRADARRPLVGLTPWQPMETR